MTGIDTAAHAVERLFERHADEIYQYVRLTLGDAIEAEDLVQDIFLDALRSWPTFQGRSAERTWLWAIARYKLVDRLRQRVRRPMQPMVEMGGPRGTGLEDVATLVDLERSLQQLPTAQRQVFILRMVQDRPSSEAAELLGWSPVKVRVTLHRALKALESQMNGGITEQGSGTP